jgi:hypothetical protein
MIKSMKLSSLNTIESPVIIYYTSSTRAELSYTDVYSALSIIPMHGNTGEIWAHVNMTYRETGLHDPASLNKIAFR